MRPTVNVALTPISNGNVGPSFEWFGKALIDTGSPLTLFPRGAAEALSLDLTRPTAPKRMTQILGKEWEVRGQLVRLTLPPFEDITWQAMVWFFEEEWPMAYGLLGDQGFMDHWVVSFNRRSNYIVVEPVTEFEQRMPPDPFEEFQKLDADWWRPTLD